jgi:hypothetical protein
MRPQDIPPRIARLNQLSNGLQKEHADLIRDDRPFTRQEVEEYLDGVRRSINGLGWAAWRCGVSVGGWTRKGAGNPTQDANTAVTCFEVNSQRLPFDGTCQ